MKNLFNLTSKKLFLVTLYEIVLSQFISIYKRLIRFVLHMVTGKSELERICSNEKVESIRIKKIENNLISSKNQYLNDSVGGSPESNIENEEILALNIMKAKNIKCDNNLNILLVIKDGLIKINAYNRLLNNLNELRRKSFSIENLEDSEKLMDLWKCLKGEDDILVAKVSKRWTELGFQGKDPGTDFRGMGMLAMNNLHFFATNYREIAQKIYSNSLHPVYGYPFAIVGINITSWIYHLLADGHLKTHFYNNSAMLARDKINLHNFNKIYHIIFVEFNSFWFVNEPNIMDFERLTNIFKGLIAEKLSNDPHAIIRENFLGKYYKVTNLRY